MRQHRRNECAQWRSVEAHRPAPRHYDETLKPPWGDSSAGVPDQSLLSRLSGKKESQNHKPYRVFTLFLAASTQTSNSLKLS